MTVEVAQMERLLGGLRYASAVDEVRRSPEFLTELQEGFKELHEGKGKSWEEVKASFGWD